MAEEPGDSETVFSNLPAFRVKNGRFNSKPLFRLMKPSIKGAVDAKEIFRRYF
jgi:hypothetical protein